MGVSELGRIWRVERGFVIYLSIYLLIHQLNLSIYLSILYIHLSCR